MKCLQDLGKSFSSYLRKAGITDGSNAILDMEKYEEAKVLMEETLLETFGLDISTIDVFNTRVAPGVAVQFDRQGKVTKRANITKIDFDNNYIEQINKAMEEEYQKPEFRLNDNNQYEMDLFPLAEEIPSVPTPAGPNYGTYVAKKKEFRQYLTNRTQVLEGKARKTPEDFREIEYLKSILKMIVNDLALIDNRETAVNNFFKYFTNDLDRIKDILEKEANIENIMLVNEYLDSLSFVSNVDVNPDNVEDVDKKSFFEVLDSNNLTPEETSLLDSFNGSLTKVKNTLKEKERQMVVSMINSSESGENVITAEDIKNTSPKYVDAVKKFLSDKKIAGGLNMIEHFILPIDQQGNSSPLLPFLRKIVDDRLAQKETVEIKRKLVNIKDDLISEMKKLGDSSKGKGPFSKFDFGMFFRKDGNGKHRLQGKFSDKWDNTQNNFKRNLGAIQKVVSEQVNAIGELARKEASAKLGNAKRKAYTDVIKGGGDFINPAMMPEVVNNPVFRKHFKDEILKRNTTVLTEDQLQREAEEYKNEIVKRFMGPEGQNRSAAERQYDKYAQEQVNKISSYIAFIEQKKSEMIRDLEAKRPTMSEKDFGEYVIKARNRFRSLVATNSPISFGVSHASNTPSSAVPYKYEVIKEEGKVQQLDTTRPSDLSFVVPIPGSNKENFNKEFTAIENNPILYKGWESFSEAITYINENRKYRKDDNGLNEFEDSIPYEFKLYEEQGLEAIADWKNLFKKSTLKRIANVTATMNWLADFTGILTSKFKDENIRKRMRGVEKSIDETIAAKSSGDLAYFKHKEVKMNQPIYLQKLSPKVREKLERFAPDGIDISMTPSQIINYYHGEMILSNMSNDLFGMLDAQLEVVEKFKAKKEIENSALFIQNLVEKDESSKEGDKTLAKNFINKHLYNINNRANWMSYKQSDGHIFKVQTPYMELINPDLAHSITNLKEILSEAEGKQLGEEGFIDDVTRGEILKDIENLESFKNSGEMIVTTGSIFEAFFLKLKLMAALGWNVPSQMANLTLGNITARLNDGLEWTEGNLRNTKMFLKKASLSKEGRAQKLKIDTFLNDIGIYQNSANEIDKLETANYSKRKFKELIKHVNPMAMVGVVEERIQKPQILSMLQDVYVHKYDKDGNIIPGESVKVFDPKGEDSMPAFTRDSNGVIRMKKEFDNEKNRDTWEKKSTQEYASIFGESGKLPKTIARINGDYRSTTTVKAKTTSLGSVMMMFKTWLPAAIMRKYGNKDGIIKGLSDKGYGANVLGADAINKLAFGAMGASLFFNPIFALGVTAAYVGGKAYLRSTKSEISEVKESMSKLKRLSAAINFTGMAQGTAGVLSKAVLQSIPRLVYAKGASNETVAKIAGIDPNDFKDVESYKRTVGEMNYVLEETLTTLRLLSMKLLVGMLASAAFTDEDEDDFRDLESEGFYKRLQEMPGYAMYIATENLLNRFSQDVNLMNSPGDLFKTLFFGNTASSYESFERTSADMNKVMRGEFEYTSGAKEGQNIVASLAAKTFLPKGITDMLSSNNAPSLGFETTSRRDYTKEDFTNQLFFSDRTIARKNWGKARENYRKELEEKYSQDKFSHLTDDTKSKIINKYVNAKFPSIFTDKMTKGKAFFDEKDQAKESYKNSGITKDYRDEGDFNWGLLKKYW